MAYFNKFKELMIKKDMKYAINIFLPEGFNS